MHTITFYPLGNADCCKIDFASNKKMLFDYAHSKESEDEDDPRIDLKKELCDDLKKVERKNYDIVGFTHADDDHIRGFSEFFFLEYAEKYQSEDRIKIKELWVPAALITDEGLTGGAKILRAEAQHRLRNGKRIKVFSRPKKLEQWLKDNDLSLNERKHLIFDAGKTIKIEDTEFFVHSPFAKYVDDELEDRNEKALIFHVTFYVDGTETKFFLIGDSSHDILSDIVSITKDHERDERLEWDIYDIPHHCSYKALAEEKGKHITKPDEEIDWLLRRGYKKCILVSSSDPVPSSDTDQPPHKQAAEYYKGIAEEKDGKFKVTMEHPDKKNPKPIIIEIGSDGAKLKLTPLLVGSATLASRPLRAG